MMVRILLACIATISVGCVMQDSLVACEDGRLCPAGTVCTPSSCAARDVFDACVGIADGEACSSRDGVCAQSLCVAAGCGNGVVDVGSAETCDDGNTVSGDGCTSACVIEACGNGQADAGEFCDDGNLTSHDGCSSVCRREVPQWSTREPSFDDERLAPAVAFVPARNRLVRFGGEDILNAVRGGTHELVENAWVRVVTTRAPSARFGAASAFDGARQRWVLFGGTASTGPVADTWEFDGVDWTERAVSGPPAGEHAMAYDATGGRIVMYCVNADVAETWAYDGSSWTKLAGSSPPPRTYTALAYDPIGARIVLFGGRQSSPAMDLDDTWELVGDTWSLVTTTTAPDARLGHSLVFDPERSALVMQGGGNDPDTWILQGSTWTELDVVEARWTYLAGLAHDPVRGRLVRYAGGTPQGFNYDDLYELRSDGWYHLDGPRPLDRSGAAITTDTKRDRVLLYGGQSWSESDFADFWAYDATGWQRIETATSPGPATYYGMAYDPVRDRVVLASWTGTWEYDGVDWSLVTTAVNTPSYEGPIIYEAARNRMLTMRGTQWFTYDGTDWTVMSTPAPSHAPNNLLRYFGGTYDSDRQRVQIFDKFDMWELEGDTWVKRPSSPSPEPRWGASLAYDPVRKRTILTCGNTDETGKQNDTWEYDGETGTWTQVITHLTYPPREAAALAWLPSLSTFVLFGGNDRNNTQHDTWLLQWRERAP